MYYDDNLPPQLANDSSFLADEPKKQKRYILTASLFIFAEDDDHAKEIALDIQKKERDQYDNQYEIECLEENKFASTKRRKILPITF